MNNKLVEHLVNYAKSVPCANEGYKENSSCQENCLLRDIPYNFGETDSGKKDYHHKEDLCFLLIHDQDINKFRKCKN